MRRIVTVLLTALAIPIGAQAHRDSVVPRRDTIVRLPARFSFVEPEVALYLSRDYKVALQEKKEHAYCITHLRTDATSGGDTVFVVEGVARAREFDATVNHVDYDCDWKVVKGTIHVHLPLSYSGKQDSAYVDVKKGEVTCGASQQDINSGVQLGIHIEAVVCGPQPQISFYYPTDFAYTIGVVPPIPAAPVTVRRQQTRPPAKQIGRTALALITLGAGVAANAIWKIDQDPGGYVDSWTSRDKALHGLTAYALTRTCTDIGAKPVACTLGVIAAGIGFEFTQGFVSRKDITFDLGGALGAYLAQRWSH
jgi:hypothetical protein